MQYVHKIENHFQSPITNCDRLHHRKDCFKKHILTKHNIKKSSNQINKSIEKNAGKNVSKDLTDPFSNISSLVLDPSDKLIPKDDHKSNLDNECLKKRFFFFQY